jgi:hypothetical protein
MSLLGILTPLFREIIEKENIYNYFRWDKATEHREVFLMNTLKEVQQNSSNPTSNNSEFLIISNL